MECTIIDIIAIVQPHGDQYKLTIYPRVGVPPFGPTLAQPCLLDTKKGRDILYEKCNCVATFRFVAQLTTFQ